MLLEGLPRCGRVSRELTGLRELDLLSLSKRRTRDLVTADVPSQGDTSAVAPLEERVMDFLARKP